MTARKVTPEELESMWMDAAYQGRESAIEFGHRGKEVLVVDGKKVAWAPKAGRS